MYYEIPDQFY